MLRRVAILLLAAAGCLTVAPLPAAQAQTTGTCVLHAPTRVAIGRPYIGLRLTMSGPCTAGGWAAWDLYHPSRGLQDTAFFDNTSSDMWDVYDFHTIGQHTWRPSGAYDGAFNSQSQNTVVSDVRLAAGAWIASSRKADVVTLTGTSLLYSPTSQSYFKRSAAGVFQYRERGTTTWKNLKSVRTSSAGTVSMSYRYSKTRDYRFALYSTPISWDLGSATTTR
ncbi:hypothetical protein FB561_5542 [Kribbella amoyensis]|uniref:Uncharacterized protein n=1 Tax=Kribbella amoyensis TaxID=996641 RepID=A0A561BZL4_9ACTN|nr:hypothetical protein [Kribbella amoyensis]TWD84355.1 hypothetical protein FB561_5542 [Kribbella amoyensis]